jgi:hypothetical protein
MVDHKKTPLLLGESCTSQVDRSTSEQSSESVVDNIRSEVGSGRGDQAIFHVMLARDQSDDPVDEEDFDQ